jgi:hypothetical protein
MNIIRTAAARRARTAIVTTLAAGAGVASLLGMGGAAQAASHAHASSHVPASWVTIDSCTGVAGQITYSPGLLTSKARKVTAVMTGTTSGCSDIFSGGESGTGTFTAVLSGKASVKAENFSGTFTINWPASTGFNPSTGTLSVTEANGLETISGTVTGGFDTGTALGLQYVTTGNTGKGTSKKPVTAQTYTNTLPLTLARNEG